MCLPCWLLVLLLLAWFEEAGQQLLACNAAWPPAAAARHFRQACRLALHLILQCEHLPTKSIAVISKPRRSSRVTDHSKPIQNHSTMSVIDVITVSCSTRTHVKV
jgi:hypothetical protein